MKPDIVKPLTTADLAALIAHELFTNGMGEKADTLRLTTADARYLGGWCEKAVADLIESHLMSMGVGR